MITTIYYVVAASDFCILYLIYTLQLGKPPAYQRRHCTKIQLWCYERHGVNYYHWLLHVNNSPPLDIHAYNFVIICTTCVAFSFIHDWIKLGINPQKRNITFRRTRDKTINDTSKFRILTARTHINKQSVILPKKWHGQHSYNYYCWC